MKQHKFEGIPTKPRVNRSQREAADLLGGAPIRKSPCGRCQASAWQTACVRLAQCCVRSRRSDWWALGLHTAASSQGVAASQWSQRRVGAKKKMHARTVEWMPGAGCGAGCAGSGKGREISPRSPLTRMLGALFGNPAQLVDPRPAQQSSSRLSGVECNSLSSPN